MCLKVIFTKYSEGPTAHKSRKTQNVEKEARLLWGHGVQGTNVTRRKVAVRC